MAHFATSKGLSLNVAKCEAVISPPHRCTRTSIGGDDVSIPVTNAAHCLGAWWTPDLSSSVWIENNIKKARGAFFARGQGVFRGSLNPLSSRSIVESCVLPILLYGADSWIINATLLRKLESFQGELAKRLLRLSKYASTRACRMALLWPSIRARVLCYKLTLLFKIMLNDDSISSRVFHSLAASDVESIPLVRQCRYLESSYGLNFTSSILSSSMSLSPSKMKKTIIDKDIELLLSEAASVPHLRYVQAVAKDPDCSWPKVWDTALDRGPLGTSCALAMFKLLSLRTNGLCPAPGCELNVGEEAAGAHFFGCTHKPLHLYG